MHFFAVVVCFNSSKYKMPLVQFKYEKNRISELFTPQNQHERKKIRTQCIYMQYFFWSLFFMPGCVFLPKIYRLHDGYGYKYNIAASSSMRLALIFFVLIIFAWSIFPLLCVIYFMDGSVCIGCTTCWLWWDDAVWWILHTYSYTVFIHRSPHSHLSRFGILEIVQMQFYVAHVLCTQWVLRWELQWWQKQQQR